MDIDFHPMLIAPLINHITQQNGRNKLQQQYTVLIYVGKYTHSLWIIPGSKNLYLILNQWEYLTNWKLLKYFILFIFGSILSCIFMKTCVTAWFDSSVVILEQLVKVRKQVLNVLFTYLVKPEEGIIYYGKVGKFLKIKSYKILSTWVVLPRCFSILFN